MARQQKRPRIELGWFEAVVLVLGYAASLGIVGVAGIYIGQRAAHQSLGGQERLIRMPIAAEERGAKLGPPGDEPRITFYDELGKPTTGEGRIVTSERLKTRDERRAARRAEASAEASHGERNARHGTGLPDSAAGAPAGGASARARATARGLAGGLPPGGSAVPPSPGATASANAERPGMMAPPVPVSRTPVPERPGTLATLTTPRPAPAPQVSPEAAATARAKVPAVQNPDANGSWSVQVNATREEATADGLAERLRARGYDAYIVKQARDGVVWYRVRVGHLPTIEKANALVREIKKREGLDHAFVASD
jgi:cell division septation protein DedD